MPTAAVVSFRLGGTDGVSVEAGKWQWALGRLGFDVFTVAGQGPVDHLLPGLSIDAARPPAAAEVAGALAGADLVVVENLCSLPLNPPAAAVVAGACRGRPTVLHHHDLPWQRPRFAHHPPPPDDPAWRHVTINDVSRVELGRRGIEAITVHNTFDMNPAPGRREATRRALGVGDDVRLVLQPTRALVRKNVAGGLALAEAVGGTYWLLGPPEDGFGPELHRVLAGAACPVLRGPAGAGDQVADAYAACDVVALPSTWEGFGNPAVESAVQRKPLVIGPYPVAAELATFGFRWFPLADHGPLRRWLVAPEPSLLDHNRAVAERFFALTDLPDRLGRVLAGLPLPRWAGGAAADALDDRAPGAR
ncbi:MAG TPA: glycosyltransferase [Acidimicrobiales bacterium]|nr:glycosyltransferase [Acidimicrobiales bacterium]